MNKMKIYKGDCLEVMEKLIEQGVKVDSIITDIPYGTTKNNWDSVVPFDEMWEKINKIKREKTTPVLLFSDMPFTIKLVNSNLKHWRYTLYWDKQIATGFLNSSWQPLKVIEQIQVFIEKPYDTIESKSDYKKKDRVAKYNPQFSLGKPNHKKGTKHLEQKNTNNNYNTFVSLPDEVVIKKSSNGMALKHPKNLISMSKGKPQNHPTEKSIELMEYLVKTYSNEGDTVLDFTMGSGSTGVACKNLNRKFIGIELEDNYFEIAKERIGEK